MKFISKARTCLASVCSLALVATSFAHAAPEPLRVLMIGNSYTKQTHEEVRAMLAADPSIKPELVAHCPDGKTIQEHASNPKVLKLLKEQGPWNVIILQEQSQLPAFAMAGPENSPLRDQLRGGAPILIPTIRQDQPNAKIILFETWARHRDPDRQQTLQPFNNDPKLMQDALTKGCKYMVSNPPAWDFSKEVTYAPVGQAFLSWYQTNGYDNKELKLHKKDNSHPGPNGAFLTAAVLYEAITNRSAVSLNYTGNLQGSVNGKPLHQALKEQAHATFTASKP